MRAWGGPCRSGAMEKLSGYHPRKFSRRLTSPQAIRERLKRPRAHDVHSPTAAGRADRRRLAGPAASADAAKAQALALSRLPIPAKAGQDESAQATPAAPHSVVAADATDRADRAGAGPAANL